MNLNIKQAGKTYTMGKNNGFEALKNINLQFQSGEFVSILGASGSGKTTLLNIIGGLDRLTTGAIIIDGKNTSKFTDRDWDAYRNASVGFVFQNYNLISHISVRRNVEMGMALCGTPPQSRKLVSAEKLESIGIEDQKNKLPNLLSGGQKQRAAIARALANNPQIILADEPTGALDSKTSAQIMKILKQISKDKLVIMVTHNAELAKKYSTRIIKLKDGEVESDSQPLELKEVAQTYSAKKTSMNLWQAIKLSLSNLLSKKGRTILTSFASSIGIIGIGLVLALSNGLNLQINRFERDILTEVPIEISASVLNIGNTSGFMPPEGLFPDSQKIVPNNTVQSSYIKTNNLTPAFWQHMEGLNPDWAESIGYEHGISMNFVASTVGGYRIFDSERMSYLHVNQNMLSSRYEFLAGNFPQTQNELLLVISKNNTVHQRYLNALGMGESGELSFSDVLEAQIKLLHNNDAFLLHEGLFYRQPASESLFLASSQLLTVSGIVRVLPDVDGEILSSGLYFLPQLAQNFLLTSTTSDIVVAQEASETPVVGGIDFFTPLSSKEMLMRKLGGTEVPSKLVIYPKGYAEKDSILNFIELYNQNQPDEFKVVAQDLSKMLTSTIRQFTDILSIALVIFASISLVVSSIMIGIVTYISVLERTKEIGILRALGATKGDVSRVFNAETMIIGFFAGTIGILSVFVLSFPANIIVKGLLPSNIGSIVVPSLANSVMLVALSVALTFVAGFIPARIASKKDPVEALRSE